MILALGAVLCACETTEATAPAVVQAAEDNQPIGTHMPQGEADLCGAQPMQWLVGRTTTEIPVPVDVVSRRVACTTCEITEDYAAQRLNIFFDQDTQIVEEVRCG